jgi:hypothetical protein
LSRLWASKDVSHNIWGKNPLPHQLKVPVTFDVELGEENPQKSTNRGRGRAMISVSAGLYHVGCESIDKGSGVV